MYRVPWWTLGGEYGVLVRAYVVSHGPPLLPTTSDPLRKSVSGRTQASEAGQESVPAAWRERGDRGERGEGVGGEGVECSTRERERERERELLRAGNGGAVILLTSWARGPYGSSQMVLKCQKCVVYLHYDLSVLCLCVSTICVLSSTDRIPGQTGKAGKRREENPNERKLEGLHLHMLTSACTSCTIIVCVGQCVCVHVHVWMLECMYVHVYLHARRT